MASIDPVYSIKLTSNDVLGAKFKHNDVNQHSVFELKRWLECRGLPISGKKEELARRCLSCVAAGKAEDLLVSIDGGKWYGKKVQQVLTQVQSKGDTTYSSAVPVLPVVGWKEFPSVKIPSDYSYGTIYEHIITNAKLSGLDGDPDITTDFNTTKPMLKGRQFFLSGHVKCVQDCSKNGYYFLKSNVMASYSISMQYNTGRCSHVTDIGVGYLSTMTSLLKLFLRWCTQIRDFGLQHMYSMRTLRVLSLAGCSLISGQGLCGLTQLIYLEELELTNCPSATKEVCLYLKENMPRCMILD